jgi:hypothetical protein
MPTQKDIIVSTYPHTISFIKLKYDFVFLFLLQTPFFTVEARFQFPYILCGMCCGQSCKEERGFLHFPQKKEVGRSLSKLWRKFSEKTARFLALNIYIFFYTDVIQICEGSHPLSMYTFTRARARTHTHTIAYFTVHYQHSSYMSVKSEWCIFWQV